MNLPELRPQPWMEEGRCRQTDPAIFFPEKGENEHIAAARWVCARCPVVDLCRDYALDHAVSHGIWGGLTPAERRRIRMGRAA